MAREASPRDRRVSPRHSPAAGQVDLAPAPSAERRRPKPQFSRGLDALRGCLATNGSFGQMKPKVYMDIFGRKKEVSQREAVGRFLGPPHLLGLWWYLPRAIFKPAQRSQARLKPRRHETGLRLHAVQQSEEGGVHVGRDAVLLLLIASAFALPKNCVL